MDLTTLIHKKVPFADYADLLARHANAFSPAEAALLAEILNGFHFDAIQAQALAQAVLQQSRFDPNAQHLMLDDDEDMTGICPHCLNPPVPPLRDYWQWRLQTSPR